MPNGIEIPPEHQIARPAERPSPPEEPRRTIEGIQAGQRGELSRGFQAPRRQPERGERREGEAPWPETRERRERGEAAEPRRTERPHAEETARLAAQLPAAAAAARPSGGGFMNTVKNHPVASTAAAGTAVGSWLAWSTIKELPVIKETLAGAGAGLTWASNQLTPLLSKIIPEAAASTIASPTGVAIAGIPLALWAIGKAKLATLRGLGKEVPETGFFGHMWEGLRIPLDLVKAIPAVTGLALGKTVSFAKTAVTKTFNVVSAPFKWAGREIGDTFQRRKFATALGAYAGFAIAAPLAGVTALAPVVGWTVIGGLIGNYIRKRMLQAPAATAAAETPSESE